MFALVMVLLAGLSCRSFDDRTGSSGIAEGPEVDVTGTWEGSWSMTVGVPDSGTVTFELEQDEDGNVRGESVWLGSPCWTNPIPNFVTPYDPYDPDDAVPTRFDGVVVGASMPTVTVMEILRDPPPTPGALRRAAYKAVGSIEVEGDSMVGTFSLIAPAGATTTNNTRCDDNLPRRSDQGVFDLRRS